MKIELKNIKHSELASHETYCFEGTVYIDGKRAFKASNEGFGGCTHFHPLKAETPSSEIYEHVKAIDAYLATLPKIKLGKNDELEIEQSLEGLLGDLVNDWLIGKDLKRNLKKICYLKEGLIWTLPAKLKPTPGTLKQLKAAKWWNTSYIILNELIFDEALNIWKENA